MYVRDEVPKQYKKRLAVLPERWTGREEHLGAEGNGQDISVGWAVLGENDQYLVRHVPATLAALCLRSYDHLVGRTDNFSILRRQWRHRVPNAWKMLSVNASGGGVSVGYRDAITPGPTNQRFSAVVVASNLSIKIAKGLVALQAYYHGTVFQTTRKL